MDNRFYVQIARSHICEPRFVLNNGVLPLLLVAATRDFVPWRWSIAWAAAQLTILAFRLWLEWAFNRKHPDSDPSPRDAVRWMRYGGIAVLASGFVWGLANLVFLLPHAQPLHWMLGLLMIGLVSGASVSVAANINAFYAYVALTIGPYLAGVVMQPDALTRTAGVVALAFTITRVMSARQYRRRLQELYRLRDQNLDLVDAMRVEKQQAEAARGKAEEANLAKSQFLAAASHDLRQPVHALGLFAEDLRQQAAGTTVSPALVDNIRADIDSLNDLLSALLDISKLDAGAVQPVMTSFRVNDIVERVAAQHRTVAQEKGLRFRFVACTATVRSDPALLLRIVGNFTANAVRYTAHGRVLVGCRRTARGIRVEVWDTGRGIPASEHAAVFREFHRLNDDEDSGMGLGLGLSIAERTAKLLDHPLTMQSEPGRGSVFRVEVPYGVAVAAQAVRQGDVLRTDLTGLVIAIVEDQESILAAMSGLLRRWGCHVVAARSGNELLASMQAPSAIIPDALLVDYQLARGEVGSDVIARVRHELGVELPCRIITGDLSRAHLNALGAARLEILYKPVQPQRLHECLAEISREITGGQP